MRRGRMWHTSWDGHGAVSGTALLPVASRWRRRAPTPGAASRWCAAVAPGSALGISVDARGRCSAPLAEQRLGIQRLVIDPQLEMHVRARRQAREPDEADGLAMADLVPELDRRLQHKGVEKC